MLNCIVVVFDTLRYDAVFGDEVETPNLRRLAERSVVFTQAWGEGEPTVPARRSLHTGMRSFPWRYHVGDRGSYPNLLGWHAIPEDQATLAEYLYQRGYATGLITDVWHLFKPTMNFTRGFVSWEFVRGQEGDTFRLLPESAVDGRRYVPDRPQLARNPGPTQYLMSVRDRQRDEDYFVAQVFTKAMRWVEENQANGPFFLWIDSFSPHEFWDPPRRYADRYFSQPGVPDYIVPQLLNQANPTPAEIARTKALYQGYVTFCDEWFGRFLDKLEQLGLLEETILIVLSDHGTELWDKGRFGKHAAFMHPYNTRLNWLIYHPDLGRGLSCDAFVQHHDLTPTVLDLLGVPHPRLDGESVWTLVDGRRRALRDHVITGWATYASVRDREWNLIVDTVNLQEPPRLYDLQADPEESRNVAAERPDVVRRQLARLEALLGGPLPARYAHRPAGGFSATVAGLRQIRERLGMVPGRAREVRPAAAAAEAAAARDAGVAGSGGAGAAGAGSAAAGTAGGATAPGRPRREAPSSNWPFESAAEGR